MPATAMIIDVFLEPGDYPPQDSDFVLLSITAQRDVQVTRRFGALGFGSKTFSDTDAMIAAALGLAQARTWTEEMGLTCFYIEAAFPRSDVDRRA